MNIFDPALMILMAEVSILLVTIAIAMFFLSRSKRNKEINSINRFIDQLEEQASFKNKPLDQLLSVVCGLDRKTVDATLKQISDSERALLQNIIQLLLQRELGLLDEIDKNIGQLSEPYCQLLSHISAVDNSAVTENADASLKRINEQLVRQLDAALQTIDEITAEYTRAFSGNQTALELENSSKKMQQIFQAAEHSIRLAMRQEGAVK